jgi:hypothetical protein
LGTAATDVCGDFGLRRVIEISTIVVIARHAHTSSSTSSLNTLSTKYELGCLIALSDCFWLHGGAPYFFTVEAATNFLMLFFGGKVDPSLPVDSFSISTLPNTETPAHCS